MFVFALRAYVRACVRRARFALPRENRGDPVLLLLLLLLLGVCGRALGLAFGLAVCLTRGKPG